MVKLELKTPPPLLRPATESDPPMSQKPIKPLKPQPATPPSETPSARPQAQIVYVTAPPKPAWRYWANLAIVAGGLLGCIVCVLILAS